MLKYDDVKLDEDKNKVFFFFNSQDVGYVG